MDSLLEVADAAEAEARAAEAEAAEEEPSEDMNNEGEEQSNLFTQEGPEAEAADGAMQVDEDQGAQEPSEDQDTSEQPQQQEKAYSTRGRSAGNIEMASNNDPLERLAREALGDLGRVEKDAPVTMGSSFLSESLTEEERRTRTRYIPEVEGMHALRKNEIKGDLQLARSMSTGTGGTLTSIKSKSKRARDEEGMDMDAEEGMVPSEDDRTSEMSLRLGAKTVEIGHTGLALPSSAFVAPPNGDTAASKKDKRNPRQVESVTAFNPPRPPESVGAKKKHRMKRWERRPADIEVDLHNYSKTLKKTRRELKSALAECERIQDVENHLRLHFFNHLECLNEEWVQLNDELGSAHQECVNAADLLTSRTRSRGAGKGSYVMKDVLGVLRTRGAEIEEKGLSLDQAPSMSFGPKVIGVGGVGMRSFQDWDRSTDIAPKGVAQAWILPGDKVDSPYGEGTVVAVYGPSLLNVKEPPHKDLISKKSSEAKASVPAATAESGDTPMPDATATASSKEPETKTVESKTDDASSSGGKKKKGSKKSKEKTEDKSQEDKAEEVPPAASFVSPRVAVRLPFGVGFFPIESVVSKEDPSKYSDSRLALRWKGLAETAITVGATLDIEAMADMEQAGLSPDAMALDDPASTSEGEVSLNTERKLRLLPFGSGMLPTADGRGVLLADMNLTELSSGINSALFDGAGVLGLPDNPGVPTEVRKLEDQRQEYINLKARSLQLRNELYRQRRTRMLNERTFAAAEERSVRMESLVTEMRADLKSLKSRLDEEVRDLGISEERAEGILTAFYQSLDSKLAGEVSPPKRPRRASHIEVDIDTADEDLGEEQEGLPMDQGGSNQ